MSPTFPVSKSFDNPVMAARRAAWANLASGLPSRPALTTLLGLLCLGSLALSMAIVHALFVQYSGILLGWLIVVMHRAKPPEPL